MTIGAAALETALETLNLARLDVVDELQAEQRGLLSANAAAFAPYDLLVYDRVTPRAPAPVPSLSFAATVPIPGAAVIADEDARPTPVTFWARAHPVMRYVTLSDVIVDRPMIMSAPRRSSEDDVTITSRELASGADAPLMLLLERAGITRILIGFALDDTNWWRDLSFPTFIANAVQYLAPTASGIDGRAFTTAEPPLIAWPGAAPGDEATLVGPAGQRTALRAGQDGRASPGPLPRAGLYEVQTISGAGAIVPVNLLDPLESTALVGDQVDIGSQIASATDAAAIAPREIWWWFIIAALVVTSIEWVFFARKMRI